MLARVAQGFLKNNPRSDGKHALSACERSRSAHSPAGELRKAFKKNGLALMESTR